MPSSPPSSDEYTIGWISTSNEEFIVGITMLDEEYGPPQYTPEEDTNIYHLGRIGDHKIAMACLPLEQTGICATAIVAENMRRTFKNIKFALLVGIGGGVPGPNKDIRLGDVVISYPIGHYKGVVQFDYGKLLDNKLIEREDWFCLPPCKILAAVDILRAYHSRPKNPMSSMSDILDQLGEEYAYPAEKNVPDRLYRAEYDHDPKADTCDFCDTQELIHRTPRCCPSTPFIHYGIIASGDIVVESGIERDKIDQCYDSSILCFETEAAGLFNLPCLVIRGISSYSDSHRNDRWRKRAAAVASAYGKELLWQIGPYDVDVLPPVVAQTLDSIVSQKPEIVNQDMSENTKLLKKTEEETERYRLLDMQVECERWLKPPNPREIQQEQVRIRLPGTCDWIWSNPTFTRWDSLLSPSPLEGLICISGPPGCGKSVLASSMVENLWNRKVHGLFFAFSGMQARLQKSSDLLRSLIWQLLEVTPKLRAVSILYELIPRGQPTTSDLWMMFHWIAGLLVEPVYCIIDGVDQVKDDIHDLAQGLHDFLQDHSNFRFILLGRQRAFRALDFLQHILELHPALTKADIDIVIDAEISRSDVLQLPKLRDKVLMIIRNQVDGNFLWLKSMIDHLKKSIGIPDALKRLVTLPRSLQTVYEDLFQGLLQTLDESEICFARKTLGFLLVSQRPLSLDECQHLLAADSMATTSPPDEYLIEDYLTPRLGLRILDLCGDIVSIRDGCLHLFHSSIRDFLTQPRRQWAYHDILQINIKDAHTSLTAACIKYLEIILCDCVMRKWDKTPTITKHYHFLCYSIAHLAPPIDRANINYAAIVEQFKKLLGSPQVLDCLELAAPAMTTDQTQFQSLGRFVSWLSDDERLVRIIEKASDCLKDEHEQRSQEFGQNDARTERISFLLSLFQDATYKYVQETDYDLD